MLNLRILWLLFVCTQFSVFGQWSTQKQVILLPRTGDSLQLDAGFVIAGSAVVEQYDTSWYFQYHNLLIWKGESPVDSVLVAFKSLHFPTFYANKDIQSIFNVYQENPFNYTPRSNFSVSDDQALNTVGNISRGIGLGNTQNVVVNSNLNLRLNGKLANDVDVFAVISDENNPIQPEGNTQQIQDFDQIFITLKKDSTQLTVGDYFMQSPQESYFIKYYKKSRGLQYKNSLRVKDWKVTTTAEAALSRGRFSRNRIMGIEGNSGPYRLNGDAGEQFIVVIAGTEVVYLDGKKLMRGEDNDYIINYNTGEITFTPRILITLYSRIVVEFQYSDRNYGRAVSHMGTKVSKGNISIYVNGFNEMDLKSQPFLQTLNDTIAKIQSLQQAGDQSALYENVRVQKTYNTERIMYIKENVGTTNIYVYAPDPDVQKTFYEVIFSNVGMGKGSYIQSISGANGKVFEYIGEGLGDYAPYDILIAPKRLNTANAGFLYESNKRKFGAEWVISSYDKNTFSAKEDDDNYGAGLKLFQSTKRLLKDSAWVYSSHLEYELVSQNYTFIERYRGVEFDRNWNKTLSNPQFFNQVNPSQEHIANASFELKKSLNHSIRNHTRTFHRENTFSGFSNKSEGLYSWNNMHISSGVEWLASKTNFGDTVQQSNTFYNWNTDLVRHFKLFSSGMNFISEESKFDKNDSLQNESYKFTSYQAFIQSSDTNATQYQLRITRRLDERPKNNSFAQATIGRDVAFSSTLKTKPNQRIQLNSTFRQLEVKDTLWNKTPVENTLQTRIELDFQLFKRFLRTKTFYQIGTGQEQKREFQFLQVQSGNGLYIWNDYDTNGIKTLNEFEIASELDKPRADYIKIYTPVAGFLTTHSTQLTQTILLNPAVFVDPKKNKQAFLGRWNSITTLLIDKKVLPQLSSFFINPLDQNMADSALINQTQNIRTTLFFNRGNPRYSIDYTYTSSRSKLLLTNGFDGRMTQSHLLNTRLSLNRSMTWTTQSVFGQKAYESAFFSNRTYNYVYVEIEPKLQFIWSTIHRLDIKSKIFTAENQVILGGEKTKNMEFGLAYNYTKASQGTFNLGFNYIQVDFSGIPSTTLGYELLRGLQQGDNLTWKLGYQKTVAQNIQVTVSYDGRSSETADTIHMGRVVARYLF